MRNISLCNGALRSAADRLGRADSAEDGDFAESDRHRIVNSYANGRPIQYCVRARTKTFGSPKLVATKSGELRGTVDNSNTTSLAADTSQQPFLLAHGTGDGGRETTVFYFVEGSPVNQGSKRTMLAERLATTATIDQGSERRAQPR